MRRIKVSVCLGPLFLSIFLRAPQQLAAQAPPAGTTIAVKMIDMVDSNANGAGKQYRASVTKAVDAGHGVVIAQGSPAIVILARNGSGWYAQLSFLSINGQQVSVTSSSASVTSTEQSAIGNAMGAMHSVLGGFGHHVKAPTGAAAVATGQRVLLPPGTTLSFVLGQPPASNPATPAAQPVMASAAPASGPAPSAASNSTSVAPAAANGRYVYCFSGQYANLPTNFHTSATEPVTYFSEVFPEPAIGTHVTVDWNVFLQKKSHGACIDGALSSMRAWKQQREDEYRKEGKKVVETGWKFNPAAADAPGQASTPASATPTTKYYAQCTAIFGERANEHCAAAANEYYAYCWSAGLDGPTMYFSDVFAFNKDVSSALSADLAGPFLQFLEDKYGIKVSNDFYPTSHYTGGSYPTACSSSLTPLSWAQRQKQLIEDNVTNHLHKQVVETGWKTSIAPLPPVTAPPAAASEYYVSCYSDTALPVQYFSEIFAAVPAGDSIHNAFLAFLQKKYGFTDNRPGSHVDCDVSAKPANAYMFSSAWSIRQNRMGLTDINKKQVVETGWKYTP